MDEAVKLWNGSKKQAKLRMSLYGRQHCIQIGKDVVRVLGAPPYITIRVNPEMDSMLIVPSEEKQPLSFKVPEDIYLNKNRQMVITSISFVLGVMIKNDLNLEETYQVSGIYSESNNAVVFEFSEAKMYDRKKG